MTAFGARSATSLLHRLTVGAFVGFVLTTILIASRDPAAGTADAGFRAAAHELAVSGRR